MLPRAESGKLQELFCDKPSALDVHKPLGKDELTGIKQAVYDRADTHMARATSLLLPPDSTLRTN